jgi:hypothetical protein
MQVLGGPEQQNKSLTRLVWSSRSFSEREAGFLFLKTFPSRENAISGLAKKNAQAQRIGRSGSQRGLRFCEGGYLSHISYEDPIQYTSRDKNAGIFTRSLSQVLLLGPIDLFLALGRPPASLAYLYL